MTTFDESPQREVAAKGFRYVRAAEVGQPKGPAHARNLGAGIARGRIVVFVDSDVCVHDDTLGLFARSFESDNDLAAVVGSYDEAPAEKSFLAIQEPFASLLPSDQRWRGKHLRAAAEQCAAISFRVLVDLMSSAIGARQLKTSSSAPASAAGHKIVLDPAISGKHLKRWTL